MRKSPSLACWSGVVGSGLALNAAPSSAHEDRCQCGSDRAVPLNSAPSRDGGRMGGERGAAGGGKVGAVESGVSFPAPRGVPLPVVGARILSRRDGWTCVTSAIRRTMRRPLRPASYPASDHGPDPESVYSTARLDRSQGLDPSRLCFCAG